MESAIERGNKALQKTTQMLPALRQAGVVDAGGQGWMFVLEGALSVSYTHLDVYKRQVILYGGVPYKINKERERLHE